ncbi:MAG: transglycosylase domain-containing protein [Desulfovibrionaceae bacterium]|nr:transglycosylase domain-containing protein [Desulfovibrionaceae bacterium]
MLSLCAGVLLLLGGLGLTAGILWNSTPDPLPAVLRWPVSPVLLDKDGTLIHARLSASEEWCLPIPLSEMGDWMPKVLVAVEDKRFYRHSGVDLLALIRAAWQNLSSGRVISGASTITSQLVRLSMPRQRTVSTKVLEFLGAWKLEHSLSKEEILEYYLNRAPFGGPIRGVEAASRLYFGKRAKELSLGEAALLVGLLKGPTAYRPDRNPAAALSRRRMIIKKVAEQTAMPAAMSALALEEPLPDFRPSMPGQAWHFADLAFKTLPPEGGVARSSLDMRVQATLERILSEHLQRAGDDVTAAGVVVDNADTSIVAYVGNARFDRDAGKQWVDCAISPRSPGSTLKPFVYIAALESGRLIPATLLADTPLGLGGEAPRNFDRTYRGPVSAHTALADSLNAPAVRVLRMLGVHTALAALRGAGFSFLNRSDAEYGDSLVLGAGEVSVLELARAYAALANLGTDRPLLLLRPARDSNTGFAETDVSVLFPYGAEPSLPSGLAPLSRQLKATATGELPPPGQLYSPAAAWLIAEILKDPGRLPFLVQLVQAREESPVAFKTGTSFGLRDAWTAAYTPAYTVVVWFGRAGGGPDPGLLGISLAAPAAIKILRMLQPGQGPEQGWYPKPEGVGTARVCALSGAALSAWCPSSRLVHDIEAVRRTTPCALHVLRDGKTAVDWPPELEDFTQRRFAGEDLSRAALIVSPMPGARYMLTPGGAKHPIALKAEGVAYPVHWYVNGEYLGEQTREDLPLYWQPVGGEHSLSLLDAEDRVAGTQIKVTDLDAVKEEERVVDVLLN